MTTWREIPRQERQWAIYQIVRQLQPLAYSGIIQETIAEQHGKDISIGRLFIILDELVEAGYLRTEFKHHPDPTIDLARGGKRASFYFATGKPRPHFTQPILDGKWQPA